MARSGKRGGATPPAAGDAPPPGATSAAAGDPAATSTPTAAVPGRRRSSGLARAGFALDRTAVLFIGVAVGVTIGLAFAASRSGNATTAPQAPIAVAHAVQSHAPLCQTPAVTAADCAAPFYPRLLKTVAKGDPISVGVFGDSFGEGIWAALYWTLPKSEHYQVFKFAERSTGFTRYQSLNLEDKAASDIAAQPVDIAVISFGANDTQGIVDGAHVYPLLSPGWKAAYGARVSRFVALLRAQGAMVYWVGLPKMRNPEFDSQIAAMNEFYSGEMAALDVPFLPTEPLSVDDQGQFNTYLVDPKTHKQELMRANDGIHMSIPGYERITGPLVDRIKAYVARSRQLAASAQPAGVEVAQAAGRTP